MAVMESRDVGKKKLMRRYPNPKNLLRRTMKNIYLYDEEICDGHLCVKDCDRCPWADKVIEKQAESEDDD